MAGVSDDLLSVMDGSLWRRYVPEVSPNAWPAGAASCGGAATRALRLRLRDAPSAALGRWTRNGRFSESAGAKGNDPKADLGFLDRGIIRLYELLALNRDVARGIAKAPYEWQLPVSACSAPRRARA